VISGRPLFLEKCNKPRLPSISAVARQAFYWQHACLALGIVVRDGLDQKN
jgi:hypothetical protein